MGKAMAQQESYQALRIFEDVVTLIVNNYVEEVQVDKVMHGAMHGLADGLDPDSAYLDVDQDESVRREEGTGGAGRTGLELTRQYYLRVIAARDRSPAARRLCGPAITFAPSMVSRRATPRCTKACACWRATRKQGDACRCCAATPPSRTTLSSFAKSSPAVPVKSRMVAPGVGYLRIAEFGKAPSIRSRMRWRRSPRAARRAS